jgi:ABC-type sugar transport system permease subunit
MGGMAAEIATVASSRSTVLFVGAMTILPLGYSVVTSFQEFPLVQVPAFVGLQNYRNLIGDATF